MPGEKLLGGEWNPGLLLNKVLTRFAVHNSPSNEILGSLSTQAFETRTATGSEPFSLLICLHTLTFTLLRIFSPLEMITLKL